MLAAVVSARPITSNAWSTPSPVSARTASTGSTCEASTVSVAPSFCASSSFDGDTSTATIREAPAIRAPWMTFKPTPPHPITATVSVGRT